MRSINHVCIFGLALALAAGCGDNKRLGGPEDDPSGPGGGDPGDNPGGGGTGDNPGGGGTGDNPGGGGTGDNPGGGGTGDNPGNPAGLVVQTSVPKRSYSAGERVVPRCTVLDASGAPALDENSEPLSNSVAFAIAYQHPDAFSTGPDGQEIAARVGTATVRCSAPALGLVDSSPEQIEITAGPPVRAVTQLAADSSIAGEPVGVTCVAFDAYNNPVTGFEQTLALSPTDAGTTLATDSVTATIAGEYQVSCVILGAADVEPATLVVMPALPSSLVVAVDPERSVYSINDQVRLLAEAHDQFGNRVDDAAFSYASSPGVPAPSGGLFRFAADGTFVLSATVTSPTLDGALLSESHTVAVDSVGLAIQCMRADAPSQPSEAYMLQSAPSTLVVPARVTGAFAVQSVTINGTPATLNASTGNYQAGVPVGFGMSFVDVVARDQLGRENSTTCFVLAAESFTAEAATMPGSIGLRLAPAAIGDPQPGGLNSINDILGTILSSTELRGLVDGGLRAANPVYDGSCGVFACKPDVTYNGGSVQWGQPSSTTTLVNGGLQVQVTLPNVRLSVHACSTTCCIGGSTISVTASSVSASVRFNLEVQGGVLRASVSGTPTVTVGSVGLDGSGFCGFLLDLLESFFTGTVHDIIRDSLASFINSEVAPLLDQFVSSLDINTLGTSFAVPRLDSSGSVGLQFGLAFSSFDITSSRALLGIGTRFTPASTAQNRPSLGIPRRTANPLLDPPGTSNASPVGLSLYEGVLNQVLHSLWRGGFFQAALQVGPASATIDSALPPVAAVAGDHAQLMLGGIHAIVRIPGIIDPPISIIFGGRANAAVSLDGDALRFGSLTLDQLFVSFQSSLTQPQRTALSSLLTQVLQSVLDDAINGGLPAFPIPTFALPARAADFGLPAGAELGIVGPRLSTSGAHFILTGSFGVRN